MDTVTYSDDDVQRELEAWSFARLDASVYPQAARALGVRAVPVAIALNDERVLGRLENFIEADSLRDWLRERRAERGPQRTDP